MNILKEIIKNKEIEIKKSKLEILKKRTDYRSLYDALLEYELTIIAEIKIKSPSEGIINNSLDLIQIARDYESAGADAISILTDKKYFGGSLQVLKNIRESVNIPVLRKDFIIDKKQIIEASNAGADAFLLIADALPIDKITELYNFGKRIGLDVLLEVHHRRNLKQILNLKPSIIGVNSRDLSKMTTSKEHFNAMTNYLPTGLIKVAESGIKTTEDLRYISNLGYNSALIGTSLMKTDSPGKTLEKLIRFRRS
tara:strand:+ start:156 stop:917 length:762 start_codon:yes stop_codon:yes gene_type:complete